MDLIPLPREFYLRPAVEVAPALLGKYLCHRTEEGLCAGRIVEAEAYMGPEDDGAHSYGGRRTARTEIQYGPGGYAYVFSLYGMHRAFNAVTGGVGKPEVVLLRALEPTAGLEYMKLRRKTEDPRRLCDGPGKLCAALGIGLKEYGLDLCGDELWIAEGPAPANIRISPRVNIDYAEKYRDMLWRFFDGDSDHVSKVPKRYREQERDFRERDGSPRP